MKRSEINEIMREAARFTKEMKFMLPPFAFWSPDEWKDKGHEYDEIRDNMLGWDITDFGLGDYDKHGLLMFTIRNGNIADDKYIKSYSEKMLITKEKQITPYHFHWFKMEDIINRGGGVLKVKLYNADASDEKKFDDTDVLISKDGLNCYAPAGTVVDIYPGESIALHPKTYHSFWGEEGKGNLLLGEISKINDDNVDNNFYEKVGRFPEIQEDEAPLYLLSNELPAAE